MSGIIIRRTTAIMLALAFISCALCVSLNDADASNETGYANDDLPVIIIKDGKVEKLPDTCTWDKETYTLVLNGGEYAQIMCDFEPLLSNDDTVFTIVVNDDCKITAPSGEESFCIASGRPITITGEGSLTISGNVGIYCLSSLITIDKLKNLTIDADMLAIGHITPRSTSVSEEPGADIVIRDCESVGIVFKGDLFGAIYTDNGSVTVENSTLKFTVESNSEIPIIVSTSGIVTDYVDETIACYDSKDVKQAEYDEETTTMKCAPGGPYQVSQFIPEPEPEPEPTPSNTGMDNLTVAIICIVIVLLLVAHVAFILRRY